MSSPSTGWRQRNSASAPTTRWPRRSTIGWNSRRNSSPIERDVQIRLQAHQAHRGAAHSRQVRHRARTLLLLGDRQRKIRLAQPSSARFRPESMLVKPMRALTLRRCWRSSKGSARDSCSRSASAARQPPIPPPHQHRELIGAPARQHVLGATPALCAQRCAACSSSSSPAVCPSVSLISRAARCRSARRRCAGGAACGSRAAHDRVDP